jgi:hypothetical protein
LLAVVSTQLDKVAALASGSELVKAITERRRGLVGEIVGEGGVKVA